MAADAVRRALVAAFRWYAARLDARPIATKSLTAGAIAAGGDLLCQHLQSRAAGPVGGTGGGDAPAGPPGKRRRPLPELDVAAGRGDAAAPRAPPPAAVARWDARRTARMGLYALAVTPAVHYWYGALARWFPASPLQRMLADQVRAGLTRIKLGAVRASPR